MSALYNHADTPAQMEAEEDPNYWIAQMDKAHIYSAIAALYGDCPVSVNSSHSALAQALRNLCNIEIVYSALAGGIHKVGKALDNGAVVVQFRHGDADWTRGRPNIITRAERLGYVNIAGYLILIKKESGADRESK